MAIATKEAIALLDQTLLLTKQLLTSLNDPNGSTIQHSPADILQSLIQSDQDLQQAVLKRMSAYISMNSKKVKEKGKRRKERKFLIFFSFTFYTFFILM